MRKLAVLLLMAMALASPVRAEETQPCDDMATAGSGAARKRNNMVKETLNAAIADPDEARDPLANCLSIVHALGDAYSMGVKLPSLEEIIAALCEYADAEVNDKITNALRRSEMAIRANVTSFKVGLSSGSISDPLKDLIK